MIHYTCIYIHTVFIYCAFIHSWDFVASCSMSVYVYVYVFMHYSFMIIHAFIHSFHFISFHFISFHFIHPSIHPSMQSLDVTSSFVHCLVRSFIHSFIPRFFISWFIRSLTLVYLSICLHCVCWGVGYKRIPGGTVQLAELTILWRLCRIQNRIY